MRRASLIFLLVLTLLTACRNDGVLKRAEMVDVLFDIYRLEGTASQIEGGLSSEQKVRYYDTIFARHHTTKEQFDRSLEWYAAHPSEWSEVYNQLETKGQRYAELVRNKQLPQLKKKKKHVVLLDTFALWRSRESMYWYDDMKSKPDSDRTRFTLEGRRYFAGTRKIEFVACMRCNSSCDTAHAPVRLVVDYLRRKSDTLTLRLPCDTIWHQVRISTGTLHGNVSKLSLSLLESDSLAGVRSFEYEQLELRNIYVKRKKHVEKALVDDYYLKKSAVREKQTTCNEKR